MKRLLLLLITLFTLQSYAQDIIISFSGEILDKEKNTRNNENDLNWHHSSQGLLGDAKKVHSRVAENAVSEDS